MSSKEQNPQAAASEEGGTQCSINDTGIVSAFPGSSMETAIEITASETSQSEKTAIEITPSDTPESVEATIKSSPKNTSERMETAIDTMASNYTPKSVDIVTTTFNTSESVETADETSASDHTSASMETAMEPTPANSLESVNTAVEIVPSNSGSEGMETAVKVVPSNRSEGMETAVKVVPSNRSEGMETAVKVVPSNRSDGMETAVDVVPSYRSESMETAVEIVPSDGSKNMETAVETVPSASTNTINTEDPKENRLGRKRRYTVVFEEETDQFPQNTTNPFRCPTLGSDVALVVEGKQLHVHKSVLSLHSPVFHRMFSSGFAEREAEEIALPGKVHEEMVNFLMMMYPVVKDVEDADLAATMALADEYQVQHVFARCTTYISTRVRSIHSKAIANDSSSSKKSKISSNSRSSVNNNSSSRSVNNSSNNNNVHSSKSSKGNSKIPVGALLLYLAQCDLYNLDEGVRKKILETLALVNISTIVRDAGYEVLQPTAQRDVCYSRCLKLDPGQETSSSSQDKARHVARSLAGAPAARPVPGLAGTRAQAYAGAVRRDGDFANIRISRAVYDALAARAENGRVVLAGVRSARQLANAGVRPARQLAHAGALHGGQQIHAGALLGGQQVHAGARAAGQQANAGRRAARRQANAGAGSVGQ